MYQKEILYLYLFRHGVKINCVGFLKSEEKKDGHLVWLQVKNVLDSLAGNFPIRVRGSQGWSEIGQARLRQGCADWQIKGVEPFVEVEIPLSDEYKIRGRSKNRNIEKEENQSKNQSIKNKESQGGNQSNPQAAKREESRSQDQGTKQTDDRRRSRDSEQVSVPKLTAASGAYPVLCEDKWEQLMQSYDQIHPYGDDRIYIKLEPRDFTVLRSGYQHLVNNSFLLHGFYNYRYLILGKEKDFYIGVPGVFYEREKMVAMMFGFEAFECEGGVAEEGKFGYYLRKVEL